MSFPPETNKGLRVMSRKTLNLYLLKKEVYSTYVCCVYALLPSSQKNYQD